MLQFILGRAGSGKTETVRKALVNNYQQTGKKQMLIVPEQYSFESEKAIIRLAGPVAADQITVVSFTRLADLVFRKEGGVSGKILSDGGRRILMNLAVEACQDQLTVYAKAAKSSRISEVMLTAVNEMKMCGISEDTLLKTADLVESEGLSEKLRELSLIYRTYRALVDASYLDSRDDLTRLADKLRTSRFFDGYTVAVDSFEGFTMQEMDVLTEIMRRAELVQIALCTDDLPEQGTGLFALVNRTKRRLLRAAKENGVQVLPSLQLYERPRFVNTSLHILEANLFGAGMAVSEAAGTKEEAKGITVFAARDIYEETEYVAATIRNLVMERGYRYNDFSVICRDANRYYGILDVALEKRQIPCFLSEPIRVDTEPLIRFVISVFQITVRGFDTERVMEMLKTGISGYTPEEISELENYCYIWRISGNAWKQPFVKHPAGYGKPFQKEDTAQLDRINRMRQGIVKPLLQFGLSTKDASGEEISKALYALLLQFHMEENVNRAYEELLDTGESGLAEKMLRIWGLLMELLSQMAAVLGTKPVKNEAYYELFKEVVRNEDISEIPQVLDAVIFGTPEQVRQSAPRVTFLIGAVQGEFPRVPKASGVFSDAERKQLISASLPLTDPLEGKTIEERYLAYSVTVSPSEMLFACYPKQADGEEKEPSEIINSLLGIFPGLKALEGLPASYYANAEEAAFSRMAALYKSGTAEAATLKALFRDNAAYAGRRQALERAAEKRDEEVADKALSASYFGENPVYSATQIETFYSCKFRYFLRYGLNAKEKRTAEVDALQYGTIMHYLFEQAFSGAAKEIDKLPDKELYDWLYALIMQYADENMGGFETISPREKYRLARLAQSALMLIRHIRLELSQSSFQPVFYELQLQDNTPYPPLRVQTKEGKVVTVGGTIDRVDLFEKAGERYVRIVDYKTGKKEFKLTDVLFGMNMQMLIYLAALVENGQELPAGILYMPSVSPSVSVSRNAGEDEIKKVTDKELKMNGIVLRDTEIIRAMEESASGRFIPAKLLKSGEPAKSESLLDKEELHALLLYAKNLVATMAEELHAGDVRAKPMLKKNNPCKYCPYGDVCGREYGEKDVEAVKLSKEEILAQMKNGGMV